MSVLARTRRERRDLRRLRRMVAAPDWYLDLLPRHARRRYRRHPALGFFERDALYDVFAELLGEGAVALGREGRDWDAERLPADTVVVHHTGRAAPVSPALLDAMHLVRLYLPVYLQGTWRGREGVAGRPIHSGHRRAGRPVHWAYHWLVRPDGSAHRLLDDHETGWHSGRWALNCRSVAVCLDGNFRAADPPADQLAGLADLLAREYAHLDLTPESLVGHGDANPRTVCPGPGFSARWRARVLRTAGA